LLQTKLPQSSLVAFYKHVSLQGDLQAGFNSTVWETHGINFHA